MVLAHDAIDDERRSLRTDHVLAVNSTTVALSNLTVRRQVKRALEIGTGCGVLALGAARHADHVVGTDTNPRALNLAVFNAAINGVTNVEWRLGSLFEAVEGERFDRTSRSRCWSFATARCSESAPPTSPHRRRVER